MNYRNINSERQFKDATGYSKSSFVQLLLDYESTYFEEKGQTYEAYVEENVTEPPRLIPKLRDRRRFVFHTVSVEK